MVSGERNETHLVWCRVYGTCCLSSVCRDHRSFDVANCTFLNIMRNGIESAAEESNQPLQIEVGEVDVSKQLSQVQNCIAAGVDAEDDYDLAPIAFSAFMTCAIAVTGGPAYAGGSLTIGRIFT